MVGKDSNNPGFLCSCSFSEKDWNEAYGAGADLTSSDSSSDSEFDPEEYQAQYPSRDFRK